MEFGAFFLVLVYMKQARQQNFQEGKFVSTVERLSPKTLFSNGFDS